MSHSIPITLFGDFFFQLFGYREYLKQSVARDLRKKYKRSALGYLWTMLHPLGMMVIISTVLSHLMGVAFKDYAVFFLIGLLAWNYFNSTVLMSLHTIRANARLFGQIAVPKYIFVVSLVFSNFVNFLLALIPLFAVMLVAGHTIPWTVLLFPIVVMPLFFVTVGVSLILSISNVFYEDTLHLSEVALQALYFLSPILYSRDKLPPYLVDWLSLNPIFCQVEFLRDILLYGIVPDPTTFGVNLVGSLFVLLAGLWVFNKAEDKLLYLL
jgi:ABC-type polysaccharide/polyol phosphate export permease